MNATHLAAAKALGFYRTGAALAVVFLANEADMCGETDGPIGQYSPQNTDGDYSTEVKVTMADCFSASQTAQLITAQSVYMQVQNLMQNGSGGTNPFLIGGVIFTNPAQKSGASEEEYGWGYNDLIQLDGGPAVDLNGNIAAGLTQIGQMTTTILNLVTNFTPSLNNLNPNSITVTIDGQATTNFTYQPSINQVNIPSPGHAGSVVNINYCQN